MIKRVGFKIKLLPTIEEENKMYNANNVHIFAWNWALLENLKIEDRNHYCINTTELGKLYRKNIRNNPNPIYNWIRNTAAKISYLTLNEVYQNYIKFYKMKKVDPEVFTQKTLKFLKSKNIAQNRYYEKYHPKFKTNKNKKISFPIPSDILYFDENGETVFIITIGHIKYKANYNFSFPKGKKECIKKFHDARITYNGKKWLLSFQMDIIDNNITKLSNSIVGIDVGVKDLAIVSKDGTLIKTYKNINKSSKMKRIIKHRKKLERKFSRQIKGSKNFEKTKKKISRLYNKQTNIRNDYIHKTTKEIIDLKPKAIGIEDFSIMNLMKNHHLSRVISEQKLFMFKTVLLYKAAWNNIKVVLANQFYPSSKLCSKCGKKYKELKLSDRTFICPFCGFTIDRDLNAAINLEKLAKSKCSL